MDINIDTLITFFGWSSVIHFSILIFALFIMSTCQGCLMNIHQKIFNIETEKMPALYMNHLGRYKILIITFSLVPYVVLKIMAG